MPLPYQLLNLKVITCDKPKNESETDNLIENQYIEEPSVAEELDQTDLLDINPCAEASTLICDYKLINA